MDKGFPPPEVMFKMDGQYMLNVESRLNIIT